MSNRFYALAVAGAMVANCSPAPRQHDRPLAEYQPASSWVPPETCLPESAAGLRGLRGKTSADLKRLADHYFNCVDNWELARRGYIAALEELARRGDASAAGGLAVSFKYQPNPDRERSLYWAREAERRGDSRGRSILEEWELTDKLRAAKSVDSAK